MYIDRQLTRTVIGLFYRVYNDLGAGFLESVYEASLAVALEEAGIAFERQVPVPVHYRGHQVGDFRADLLVEHALILELKAARVLEPIHEAQLLNYLRATDIELGLLMNFGPKPEFKRFLLTNDRKLNHRFAQKYTDQR